jgi:hypothetical protein
LTEICLDKISEHLIISLRTMSKRKFEEDDSDSERQVKRLRLDPPKTTFGLSMMLFLGLVDYKALFILRSLNKYWQRFIVDRLAGKHAKEQLDAVCQLMKMQFHPWDVSRSEGKINKQMLCSWFKMHAACGFRGSRLESHLRSMIYIPADLEDESNVHRNQVGLWDKIAALLVPKPFYRTFVTVAFDSRPGADNGAPRGIDVIGFGPSTPERFSLPDVINLWDDSNITPDECRNCMMPMSRLHIARQNGGRIEYRASPGAAWTGPDSSYCSVASDQLKFDAENHPYIDCELSGRKSDLVCVNKGLDEVTSFVSYVHKGAKNGKDLPRQKFTAKALGQDGGLSSGRRFELNMYTIETKIDLWREMRSAKEEVLIPKSKTETDFLNDSRLFASGSRRITLQMVLYSSRSVFGYGADMQPLDIQRDFNWSFKPPRD